MAQLLIRNIAPEVIKRLKNRAKQHHRSLQAELKCLVESATKMSMAEALQASKEWQKRLSGHSFSNSTDLLREDRDR